jgi:hypothetical protein
MNPFYISRLLSEAISGECQAAVLVRRHILGYGDEQNYGLVPPDRPEAGGVIQNGFDNVA